jgi:hypothetical protein
MKRIDRRIQALMADILIVVPRSRRSSVTDAEPQIDHQDWAEREAAVRDAIH